MFVGAIFAGSMVKAGRRPSLGYTRIALRIALRLLNPARVPALSERAGGKVYKMIARHTMFLWSRLVHPVKNSNCNVCLILTTPVVRQNRLSWPPVLLSYL